MLLRWVSNMFCALFPQICLAFLDPDGEPTLPRMSLELNIPQTTIWDVLWRNGISCWKPTVIQKLHPGDPQFRVERSQGFQILLLILSVYF